MQQLKKGCRIADSCRMSALRGLRGNAAVKSELVRLGEALAARTEDVVGGVHRRTDESGQALDAVVEASFEQVGRVSTLAVARWMAGEGEDVARSVGQEAWLVFGQLAAQHEAPLHEATKRCLRWRDSVKEVLCEEADRRRVPAAALSGALAMVQRSLDVTLVRMCQSFEEEHQRIQEELTFQASHDPLTGLPNRVLMTDRLEQVLARSRRVQIPVAVIFIDLDNFKNINDTLGHHLGDQLLQAVASRLRSALRETDTLGRLNGDEFVVITEGMSLAAGPELVAERLLEMVRSPFNLYIDNAPALTVTASLGIATDNQVNANELLRQADLAMVSAKAAGKNCYVAYNPDMNRAAQSRLELEMDLHRGIEGRQFYLQYQPTFDLETMRVTAAEALLRWAHPTRGPVSPGDFVPLLEETGMITVVGKWVLEEACRQTAAWHRAGHRIGIAVNVSARQLDSEQFIDEVHDALVASGLDPNALILEITETALMRDAEATARRLTAIKTVGVRIAIDDFGTGYSSFAHLRQFPVDALKIDQSFISSMLKDREGETLVHTLVQLGKALSIETFAEGIEELDQLQRLRDEACDSGQGFLVARPLSPAKMEEFLEEWNTSHPMVDDRRRGQRGDVALQRAAATREIGTNAPGAAAAS